NLQAEASDRPKISAKCGLSRCQPMPTPAAYSVHSICRTEAVCGPAKASILAINGAAHAGISAAGPSPPPQEAGRQPQHDARGPRRNICGRLEPAARVVVSPAERCDAALALVRAELERHQGERANVLDEVLFLLRRDEIGLIAQPLGTGCRGKKVKLRRHPES